MAFTAVLLPLAPAPPVPQGLAAPNTVFPPPPPPPAYEIEEPEIEFKAPAPPAPPCPVNEGPPPGILD